MKQPSFDDIIRKKTEKYEAPVPADAWENIVVRKKKKRRVLLFWWIFVLLLLSGGTTILYNSNIISAVKNYTNVPDSNLKSSNTEKQNSGEIVNNKTTANNNNKKDSVEINDKLVANSGTTPVPIKQAEKTVKKISTYNELAKAINQLVYINKQELTIKPKRKKNQQNNNEMAIENVIQANSKNEQIISPAEKDSKNNLTESPKIAATETEILNKADLQDYTATGKVTADRKATKNDNRFTGANSVTLSTLMTDSKYFLPSFLLHTIVAHSNSDLPIKTKLTQANWNVDFSIGPTHWFRKRNDLLLVSRTNITNDAITEFKADEIKTRLQPGMAVSIALRKKIAGKMELSLGFQYAITKEKINLSGTETTTHFSIVKKLVNDNNGTYLINDTAKAFSSGKRVIDALNSYSTFSMPIGMQARIATTRFYKLDYSSGLYLTVFKHYKNSVLGTFSSNNTVLKQKEIKNSIGIDLYSGIRFSTIINKKIWLFAEPGIRFNLLKSKNNGLFNNKNVHQFAVAIGVSYSF